MALFHPIQSTFTAGELSPRLDGRIDIKRYKEGLAILQNGVVRVQGGIERRAGTRFQANTKTHADQAILVPFEYSDIEAYAIEFGALYARFFKNDGRVVDPTELVTNGTFDADVASWSDESTGSGSIAWNAGGWMDLIGAAASTAEAEQAVSISVTGVEHRLSFEVKSGTVTVQIGTSSGGSQLLGPSSFGVGTHIVLFTPTVATVYLRVSHAANATYGVDTISVKKAAYEVVTPYSVADLANLRFFQSADTLFLLHPDHEPRTLTRSSDTSWTLAEQDFVDGPYLDPNTDTTKTLKVSAGTGVGVTMTAAGHTPFLAGHVGSLWRLTHSGTNGYVKVTGYTSSTVVTVDVKSTIAVLITMTATNTTRKLNPSTSPNTALAQRVKHDVDFSFKKPRLRLKRNGTLTGKQVWLELWIDNGQGRPSTAAGSLVQASATVDAGALSTSFAEVEFDFPVAYTQLAGVPYHLVLKGDYSASDANNVEWDGHNADQYANGEAEEYNGSWAKSSTIADFFIAQDTTPDWREGAWSDVRGFPRDGVILEDRTVYGGTDFQPQTVWMSKTADWVNFTPGADDADPITATVSSNRVNVIRWLASGDSLLIGTLGEEFSLTAAASGPIKPSSLRVRQQSSYGSANIKAVPVGSSLLFLQRSGKRIREMAFDANAEKYNSTDISLLAEHLFKTYAIVDWALQREPDQIVWMVREDGVLIGFTFDKVEQVVAFHRHTTQGFFERVCVIPHRDGDHDELWAIVRRTINGQARRFVEQVEEKAGFYELFHTDCTLQYVGDPVSSVTGLAHLIGETVHIQGDGAVHPPQVVDATGSVALQTAASIVEIGLPYTTTMQTMRPEVALQNGTSQGRRRRWPEVKLGLVDTLGGTIQGEVLPSRLAGDPMDGPPALYSGFKRVNRADGWSQDGRVTASQTQPLPFEIIMLTGVLEVGDT